MGRPRIHDVATREALIGAAERLFEVGGPAGVSVRRVAEEAGTTTRAVYSLFGSQEGLLIEALGVRAFDLLADGLAAHPETGDPAGDLVEMGIRVFRTFVLDHPALFQLIFQRAMPLVEAGPELRSARERALELLLSKVGRLNGGLGSSNVETRTVQFEALLEGLGNLERRGAILRMLPEGREEDAWRDALRTLVRGFTCS